jgi:hypothetical protein
MMFAPNVLWEAQSRCTAVKYSFLISALGGGGLSAPLLGCYTTQKGPQNRLRKKLFGPQGPSGRVNRLRVLGPWKQRYFVSFDGTISHILVDISAQCPVACIWQLRPRM